MSPHRRPPHRLVSVDESAVDLVVDDVRRVALNRKERREVIRRLTGRVSDQSIADRLGITRDAVHAVRVRMRRAGEQLMPPASRPGAHA